MQEQQPRQMTKSRNASRRARILGGCRDNSLLDNSQTSLQQKQMRRRKRTPSTGFLFHHTDFVQALSKLKLCLNDGITDIMPIVTYCEEE